MNLSAFKTVIDDMKHQIVTQLMNNFNDKIAEMKEVVKNAQFIEKKLEICNLNFEKYKRRKNIIIKGVTEIEKNTAALQKNVLDLLNNKLKIKMNNCDIDNIFRLGEKKSNHYDRPIMLKLKSEKLRNEIFKKKFLLKGSKIFVDPDLPREVLKQQYIQRKKNRKQPKNFANENGKTRRNSYHKIQRQHNYHELQHEKALVVSQ